MDEILASTIHAVLTAPPDLPSDLADELAAMHLLSDEALWTAVQPSLSPAQETRLKQLNRIAGERPLTQAEAAEQTALLEAYHRSLAGNLCLACPSCNGYKQAKTHGVDPVTGERVPLFHPRQQRWGEHFAWSEDGTHIIGLTPCGRATVEALRLNHSLIVVARAIWVQAGYHPPERSEGMGEVGAA